MTDRPVTGPSSNPDKLSIAPERTAPAPARPAQLDDRDWLKRAYEAHGDRRIALDLGVKRGAVRRARDRLGIPSRKQGPRQGLILTPIIDRPYLDATEQAIIDRIRLWRDRKVPATETTLNTAIAGAHGALTADEAHAYDAALIDIAAASALVYEHRQKVRRAA